VVALKVVVDTNVVIAALRSAGGINRQVIRELANGRATPLVGEKLFFEYLSVSQRSEIVAGCPLSEEEQQAFIEDFLSLCIWVRVYYLWRPNLADEGDNHILELALAGGAGVVVTNNRADFQGGELRFPEIRIMTPSEFVEELT
jgi:predicted nucleic acid-binding protein